MRHRFAAALAAVLGTLVTGGIVAMATAAPARDPSLAIVETQLERTLDTAITARLARIKLELQREHRLH